MGISALTPTSIPRISCINYETTVTVKTWRQPVPVPDSVHVKSKSYGRRKRLNAAFHEIEPDLNEDPIDRWNTQIVGPQDFEYGKWDDHHTYFEGEEEDTATFWESVAEDYAACEPPMGFQGIISWLFLPAVAAGMYFNAPGEYVFIGAGLFTIVFCVIEMNKPAKPHNFEPQIYNMERGARDKLINDYNTMSIWDFNDKYGELWDFTIDRKDLARRERL